MNTYDASKDRKLAYYSPVPLMSTSHRLVEGKMKLGKPGVEGVDRKPAEVENLFEEWKSQ